MSLERTAPDEYFTDFDPEAMAKKLFAKMQQAKETVTEAAESAAEATAEAAGSAAETVAQQAKEVADGNA